MVVVYYSAQFTFLTCPSRRLLMAVTLWTGNEVYLHLTVAFIQVRKTAINPPNFRGLMSGGGEALGALAAAGGDG